MAFLKNNMPVPQIVEGVVSLLPPTEAEVRRCDALSDSLRFEEGKDPAALLPELFLLKISLACEYAMGMLEQLGMKEEGVAQFYEFYTARLANGFVAFFQSMPGHSVVILKSRMDSYHKALHEKHPEDAHLNVADLFTRYAGAPDDPLLVTLCLDVCKEMNQAFLDEIASLGIAP
jgi:hypothetical protein